MIRKRMLNRFIEFEIEFHFLAIVAKLILLKYHIPESNSLFSFTMHKFRIHYKANKKRITGKVLKYFELFYGSHLLMMTPLPTLQNNLFHNTIKLWSTYVEFYFESLFHISRWKNIRMIIRRKKCTMSLFETI